MEFLPCELINEILLKVPLKCVVRLKCVCKLWYTLISDPYYAMLCHERVTPSSEERILCFNNSITVNEFRSMECNASLYDDSAYFKLNPNFLPSNPGIVSILGSCRGFLHLISHKVAGSFLWNPFTEIHKHIPMSPSESHLRDDDVFSTYSYGFGYDPSIDDYLLVQISGSSQLRSVEIFSVRANAWKEIETPILTCGFYSLVEEKGSYLNGALHWITFKDSTSTNIILVFDLKERSFSEMPFPVDFEYQTCALTLLDNRLCAVGKEEDSLEIWMMREYKVNSSWTKKTVISLDGTPIQDFFPIYYTKSGNIVGRYFPSGLAMFNDKGELIEHRLNGPFLSEAVAYRESLFSLSCDNEITTDPQRSLFAMKQNRHRWVLRRRRGFRTKSSMAMQERRRQRKNPSAVQARRRR